MVLGIQYILYVSTRAFIPVTLLFTQECPHVVDNDKGNRLLPSDLPLDVSICIVLLIFIITSITKISTISIASSYVLAISLLITIARLIISCLLPSFHSPVMQYICNAVGRR